MGVLAIELNDAGLRAARGPGDDLLPIDGEATSSPGFALVEKKAITTGDAAARQAQLHPLEIDSRFWSRLDLEPMTPRNPRSPNRAEVACAHLELVLEGLRPWPEDVVFAVPPVYETEQLGILAGIARELKLPLRGLVASPLALDGALVGAGIALVVELTLHRCLLSVVEVDTRVTLQRTRVCPEVGLSTYRRQWVSAIGDAFVRNTRFDPLHDAATEQRLHDRLPAALDALAGHGSFDLSLEAGATAHRVTITEQTLAHAGHELGARLAADVQAEMTASRAGALLLSHEVGQVPGLERMLRRQTVAPVTVLAAGAAATGLARLWPGHFERPPGDAVTYHTARAADRAEASTDAMTS